MFSLREDWLTGNIYAEVGCVTNRIITNVSFSSPGLIYNAAAGGEKHQQRRKRINQQIILLMYFL
ncbi:MAG TPA: hypothetical protein VNA26_08700 [Chitinophagaceae bacterium]|nr:hypothetical protein [Chitinophagaceae bacterium]